MHVVPLVAVRVRDRARAHSVAVGLESTCSRRIRGGHTRDGLTRWPRDRFRRMKAMPLASEQVPTARKVGDAESSRDAFQRPP